MEELDEGRNGRREERRMKGQKEWKDRGYGRMEGREVQQKQKDVI
jgi:hypothetical protein